MYSTIKLQTRARLLALCLILPALAPLSAWAVDTDIFSASSNATAPNVLIILDNTASYDNGKQQFPGGAQGRAEADAIKQVISNLGGFVNVGLMEFVTASGAGSGGYIRYAISPMGSNQTNGPANQAALSTQLTNIYNNFRNTNEKASSTNQVYGNLMYEAYNYFAGLTPYAPSSDVVSSLADPNGYVTNYTRFKSPLSATNICDHNYIVFIGNPEPHGPVVDSTANTAALASAGGDTSQLKLQQYSATTQALPTNLGYSSACYTSAPAGTPTDYASQCPSASGAIWDSCSYSTSDTTTALPTCAAGTTRYPVMATIPTSTPSSSVVTTTTNTGTSSSCYASSNNWSSSDTGTTPACPANTSVTSGGTTTSTTYSCSYALTSSTPTSSCASTVTGPTIGTVATTSALSTSCYSKVGNGNGQWSSGTNDYGGLTCPATTSSTSGATTTATTYSCTYSGALDSATGCSSGNHVKVSQAATPSVTTTTTSSSKYGVTQTVTKTVATSTVTGSTQTTLGNTFACYSSLPSGTPTDYTCPSGATCSYGSTPTTTGGTCPAGARYQAIGFLNTVVETPTNPAVYQTDTHIWNSDEWARFLDQTGVSVAGSAIKARASTYTIDVYGAKPDPDQSSLLSSMAKNGGGRYFAATNEAAIVTALKTIFGEIQATNSTFASAALPISATQRSQNDNQVYIGMFRPDPQSMPRWFGNLKRYQLGIVNGGTDLVDVNNLQAVSTTTGFVTPCAQSFWTIDSGNYWANVSGSTVGPRIFSTTATIPGMAWTTQGDDTVLAKGGCTTLGSAYSDLPDGPTVEKGGAAEIMRNATSRKVKTLVGSSLVDFNSTNVTISSNSTINSNIVNFILGQDVTGEIGGTGSSSNRPSIHGAVVHSRPLPVDYGVMNNVPIGVRVFYGSNDGTYRSINATTGVEDWAFVPSESYPYFQRLMDNTPVVQTPSPTPPGQTAAPGTPQDFFFDGSSGLYQNSDNSKVWIYPAMRRGGRMLHAFDVSTPGTASTFPTFKWKVGCPNQGNDTGCTTGMSGIGQTWSTPNLVFLGGYSTTTPVVVVGGGYDTCEDADSNPSVSGFCASPKGARVYVLDANDGTVVASFATDRSVAADVSLVDINQDGKVDAAYVADTGGNLYRINFSNLSTFAALDKTQWTITKVAYTSGASRKFLFAPALLPYRNKVYVAIGSGDREHPTALSYPYTTPVVNRAYVYLDDPTGSTATNLDAPDTMLNRTDATADTCSSSAVLPGSAAKGWYMDLTAYGTGEQTVTSAIITGGLVAFSTNRPIADGASCSTGLGEARGYWLNLLNGSGAIGVAGSCGGSRSSVFVGGGLPPSPVTGVVTINGVAQNVVIGATKRDGSTSTPIGGQKLDPAINSKRTRIYWRTSTDTH